jgi:OFA family oxalate/formate antiporter-like MFS transporter
VSNVFMLYGVLFAVLVALGSIVLVNPPAGYKPAGWEPKPGTAASSGTIDFTVSEMARTPQYWSLFAIFVFGATAGLMVIGIIGLFGKEALAGNGVEAAKAGIIAGTAMGLFYALMNGFGRIIWGSISDKLGRKNSLVIMTLIQGVTMISFYFIGGTEWGLYAGAAIIGFNFGGNFALFPAATADYFGNKNVGTNYPWVFMAYGVGGVIGPILGGAMGDAKAWMWAFIPSGIACLVGSALALTLKPPAKKAA